MATASRSLLLTALAALAGCPAEQLGVKVPARGAEAISQDDVQRDLFLLAPPPGQVVGDGAALARRLAQVGLEPAFESGFLRGDGPLEVVCGLHPGRSGGALLVLAQVEGPGATQGVLREAALVSLAKSVDRTGDLVRPAVFCRLGPTAGPSLAASPPLPWEEVADIVLLGSLGGASLALTPATFEGRPARAAAAGAGPLAGTPADGLERLDYRMIERHLKDLHVALLADLIRAR